MVYLYLIKKGEIPAPVFLARQPGGAGGAGRVSGVDGRSAGGVLAFVYGGRGGDYVCVPSDGGGLVGLGSRVLQVAPRSLAEFTAALEWQVFAFLGSTGHGSLWVHVILVLLFMEVVSGSQRIWSARR